jgi:hypothetical protein
MKAIGTYICYYALKAQETAIEAQLRRFNRQILPVVTICFFLEQNVIIIIITIIIIKN